MLQFNSKKLIILCRKLVGMIEDNQIAEELTGKLVGIENKYLSTYEFKNKYKIRVEEMVSCWNYKCLNSETVTILELSNKNIQYNETTYYLRITSRYNSLEKRKTRQEDEVFNMEDLYKWAFALISDQGMTWFFSKNSNIRPEQKQYNDQESFNVTHA